VRAAAANDDPLLPYTNRPRAIHIGLYRTSPGVIVNDVYPLCSTGIEGAQFIIRAEVKA
jgi:hypothetical protein